MNVALFTYKIFFFNCIAWFFSLMIKVSLRFAKLYFILSTQHGRGDNIGGEVGSIPLYPTFIHPGPKKLFHRKSVLCPKFCSSSVVKQRKSANLRSLT